MTIPFLQCIIWLEPPSFLAVEDTIPPVPVRRRVSSGKRTGSTSFEGKQCPNSTCTSQFIIGASLNEQLNLPTDNIICSFNTRAWSMYVCRPVDVCVIQLSDIVGRRHWLINWLRIAFHYSTHFISPLRCSTINKRITIRCSTIQWPSSTTRTRQQGTHVVVTVWLCIHVYTPTLSCSVAMTTWHLLCSYISTGTQFL